MSFAFSTRVSFWHRCDNNNASQNRSLQWENAVQFSLKSLIVASIIVALTCAAFFAMPQHSFQMIYRFAILLIPSVLLSIIVYGRRYARAFAVGAVAPIFATIVFTHQTGSSILDWGNDYYTVAMLMLIVAIGGIIGCITFWASLDPETTKQPERQSRMTQLVTGLAMGLLLGGLVAFTGSSIFGLGPTNSQVDLAIYPNAAPMLQYPAQFIQAPPPIPIPSQVPPTTFEPVDLLPPESGRINFSP